MSNSLVCPTGPETDDVPQEACRQMANHPDDSPKDFVALWEECKALVEADRIAAKGDLYFVRAGDAVKIGHTTDIIGRLRKIQVDNHEAIDCVLVLRGCGHKEIEWQERFQDARIRGEWFRWTDTLAAAIDEARAAQCSIAVL